MSLVVNRKDGTFLRIDPKNPRKLIRSWLSKENGWVTEPVYSGAGGAVGTFLDLNVDAVNGNLLAVTDKGLYWSGSGGESWGKCCD